MPVLDHFEHNGCYVMVWQILESEEELRTQFAKYSKEDVTYSFIKSAEHRKQKIASRLVSATLFDQQNLDYDSIQKDEMGKPRVLNSPFYFSVSHTKDYAACIIGKKLVGIDIELVTLKIQNIKHKFCNGDELFYARTDERLIEIWGAKEAMYKAYGKKKVLFAENMNVKDNRGILKKNGMKYHFDIHSKIYIGKVMMVLAHELYRE